MDAPLQSSGVVDYAAGDGITKNRRKKDVCQSRQMGVK